ncbi:hypothetical protein [Cytobacillus purgationiresistens]|uniref:Uncharacterized protein n=1 Tax=Cytobacillus purgationiresistens TaxID=863449 RepID=A0ABU0ABV8_9BACI|nr:hypothetical protein [Cytobacillus purgationiresistens]MDQ0268741.1 hypothetical protein [Cytobacillus purgationiresistens]
MFRIFFLLLGFGLSVSGGISAMIHLNLFAAGLKVHEYFIYMLGRVEFYFLPIGIIIIWLSIYFPIKEFEA